MSKSHPLQQWLDSEIVRVGTSPVQSAAVKLIDKYRKGEPLQFRTEEDCLAYALVRFPATYQAILRCLRELPVEPSSVLDLGAGLGSTAWAAIEAFGPLERITLVEGDSGLAALGRRAGTPCTQWIVRDLTQIEEFAAHDLVVFAHSWGELSESARPYVLNRAWRAARTALLIIEAGTPAGYHRVLIGTQPANRLWRSCGGALPAFLGLPDQGTGLVPFLSALRSQPNASHRERRGPRL